MTIPKTVRVLGKTYRVVVGTCDVDLWKRGRTGEVDHPAQEIRLRGDLSHEQMEESFLHELLHCVEYAVVPDNVPESTVYCLSGGLYALLKDNGWWPNDLDTSDKL